MGKYINCKDCQNHYDCERTYLGGCTDGKEWENETEKAFVDGWEKRKAELKDKKETKEKVIETIQKAVGGCARNWASLIADELIKSGLIADKTNAEQKAEIERLTEENEYLDGCAKQFLADYQKCEIANVELQELNAKYYNEAKDLRRENAELQKQVDELKEKRVIECHGMLKGCDMVKQAVKDTAKEIFDLLKSSEYVDSENTISIWAITKILKERYGVEVE